MVDLNIELPNNFFDEEEKCGFVVTKKRKELWAVELDLLNELQRVCIELNIKCIACGGTLLGAVRHKGFIPWDDDVDVLMFRDDYEKLKENKNLFKKGYFFQNPYTDDIIRPHSQLRKDGTTMLIKTDYGKKHHRGVFIDIFILDKVPNSISELDEFRKEIRKTYFKMFPDHERRGSKYKRLKKIYNITVLPIRNIFYSANVILNGGLKNMYIKFERLCSRYQSTDANYVADVSFNSFNNRLEHLKPINKSYYENLVELQFENLKILAPHNYDEILRIQYGDYTKFVIGSSMHGSVYIDLDNDYSAYDCLNERDFNKLFETEDM